MHAKVGLVFKWIGKHAAAAAAAAFMITLDFELN